MKQKFEKELKVKISKAMHRELSEIANQAGLYLNEIIRYALRHENRTITQIVTRVIFETRGLCEGERHRCGARHLDRAGNVRIHQR